jgi:hypothetical protein
MYHRLADVGYQCWRTILPEEALLMLARRAPKQRAALRKAKRDGLTYVVIDGTLIPVDRIAADRPFRCGTCHVPRKLHKSYLVGRLAPA